MLAIKISVNTGHTATGAGHGTEYKGVRESKINRSVVKSLIPKLQKLGHTVHNSTVDTIKTNKFTRIGFEIFFFKSNAGF